MLDDAENTDTSIFPLCYEPAGSDSPVRRLVAIHRQQDMERTHHISLRRSLFRDHGRPLRRPDPDCGRAAQLVEEWELERKAERLVIWCRGRRIAGSRWNLSDITTENVSRGSRRHRPTCRPSRLQPIQRRRSGRERSRSDHAGARSRARAMERVLRQFRHRVQRNRQAHAERDHQGKPHRMLSECSTSSVDHAPP